MKKLIVGQPGQCLQNDEVLNKYRNNNKVQETTEIAMAQKELITKIIE